LGSSVVRAEVEVEGRKRESMAPAVETDFLVEKKGGWVRAGRVQLARHAARYNAFLATNLLRTSME
jgi:hypothetical protein